MLPLVVKIILVLFLLFIIFNLARALIQMVREPNDDDERPMSYYLGRRLIFSAFVVILLIFALLSGWLHPNHTPY
ncbi:MULTISPECIES: DUF2909 domain-containing protein [Vibrio]|jgi:uncharacterized membrane protein|uniref:DUF2909 domain-containing protein n=2 Tax=Vibrio TaxID=662 RepID=A0A2J8H5F5_VIBDI|nr:MULTISPECIES: DUF2909 domain-containing protein [Vibrio]MBD0786341.1 DUF2909 domain-containing protein [Vibrio sp. Y2-5]MCZ4372849.1 DUF2909 domain-containing protein [Vibrio diazotrophicus]MDW6019868.1 DUF2909 domain-containing protein [Vibrio plantisponsor]NIY94080.1 DUF2909 domain-containing protein [Vibrio diazotrophicus]NNM38803.1 DUF2909 domain-containing protein [Vibrio plantisponsor]